MKKLPTREKLLTPIMSALIKLGGSGSIDEITEQVILDLNIPDEIINIPHDKAKQDGRTELEYQLAWARTMLKANGYITNSKRGVWAILNNAKTSVQELSLGKSPIESDQLEEVEENWKSKLLKILIDNLTPDAFERLIQRFLREKGFSQVEVTGRSGDGGIDGKGIAKINGILSFYIVFQCKKYKGAVSASQVRDFRGAMSGRTDKGLFITTGYFTRDAVKEANRDGAPIIDLIDGEKLTDKLKELSLGVNIELIEKVNIDEKWFNAI